MSKKDLTNQILELCSSTDASIPEIIFSIKDALNCLERSVTERLFFLLDISEEEK